MDNLMLDLTSCEPNTRSYNGKINCDQESWIESEIRRAIWAAIETQKILRGRDREIVLDAIVEAAVLEIADIANMEVDRTNIITKR